MRRGNLSFLLTTKEISGKIKRMKRSSLLRHLSRHGVFLVREGRRHSIYCKEKLRTEVPRHTKIVDELARKICRDLDIPYLK